VADLDVRRSRTSPWAYVLGGGVLLAVILLTFLLLGGRGDPERADAMERGELPHEPPTIGPATADVPAPGDPGEGHIPVVRETMVACTGHPVADEPFVRDCIDRFDGALTALMDRGGLHPAGAREQLVAFQEHARHVVSAPPGDPALPALTRAALALFAETFAAPLAGGGGAGPAVPPGRGSGARGGAAGAAGRGAAPLLRPGRRPPGRHLPAHGGDRLSLRQTLVS
jgi:hypothetical protein